MGKKLLLVDTCTYETDEDGKLICCKREYAHKGRHFLDWYDEIHPMGKKAVEKRKQAVVRKERTELKLYGQTFTRSPEGKRWYWKGTYIANTQAECRRWARGRWGKEEPNFSFT